MLSTYLSYNLVTRDLLASLNRTAGENVNAREATYYKENIGKVSSVDEFLDDYRLYSYAMKAYGLEEMTYAKAFMRKVLESDISDADSFANQLTDDRYRTFAAAFSFGSAGETSAQTEAQLDAVIGLYTATAANAGATMKEETRYYNAVIDTVKSADQLLNNERLRTYVFTAYGIDQAYYSRDVVKRALSSNLDPSSPNYFYTVMGLKETDDQLQAATSELLQLNRRAAAILTINTLETDMPVVEASVATLETEIADLEAQPQDDARDAALAEKRQALADYREYLDLATVELADAHTTADELDAVLVPRSEASARASALQAQITAQEAKLAPYEKYRTLTESFNFNADGTATAGSVQTAAQKTATNDAYVLSNSRVTTAAAVMNRDYFESKIGSITSADELIADKRLVSYIKVAFGLDKISVVNYTVRNILTSDPDPDNPNSYINKFGGADKEKYIALRAAFNFGEDGTLAAGDTAQTAAQTQATTNGYMVSYNDKDDEADAKAISRFKSQIGAVTNVQEFVGEASVYEFALKAFGIDPTRVSALTIKNVLKSDLNDPKSYVYTLGDTRFVELAKAFNFGADGNITQPKLAQSEAEILAVSRAYVTEKSRFGTADDKTLAEEEAKYYARQMQTVDSVEAFLSDPRLVAFVLEANGIDPASVDATFMAKIFASDLEDPESFANQQADRSYRKIVASFNFGADGKVVRPDAAEIQSRRGIYETIDSYVRQMMEEEAGTDNAGVRLALYFERKASSVTSAYDLIADDALFEVFKVLFSLPDEISNADVDAQADMIERYLDLKDLQDPEAVAKMIVKFSVLYDADNASTTDPALAVLTASGSAGISADLMMSLAQLRIGGR